MSSKDDCTRKKRKRTKNTSTEQYEIYLSYLENDVSFRRGTNDPEQDADYIEKKWIEMTKILNTIDNGPHLSADEWKKRFTDWKYSIRAKYRKIFENRHKVVDENAPGSIKFSPMEERALSLWGRVVITPFVNSYDGLPPNSDENTNISHDSYTPLDLHLNENHIKPEVILHESPDEIAPTNTNEIPSTNTIKKLPLIRNKTNYKTKIKKSTKPISIISDKLLMSSERCEKNSKELNNTIKQFFDEYLKIKSKKLKLDKKKLKFEIAKYVHQNPDFHFSDDSD